MSAIRFLSVSTSAYVSAILIFSVSASASVSAVLNLKRVCVCVCVRRHGATRLSADTDVCVRQALLGSTVWLVHFWIEFVRYVVEGQTVKQNDYKKHKEHK